MLAANVRDASSFRSQHPLVPVGRKKIDSHLVHVERKCAETLNRIAKQQRPTPMRDLGYPPHVVSITGGVSNPTHRDDARPLITSFGKPLKIKPPSDVRRHASRRYTATFEIEPRVNIRRK